jgi:hypothetical protein
VEHLVERQQLAQMWQQLAELHFEQAHNSWAAMLAMTVFL